MLFVTGRLGSVDYCAVLSSDGNTTLVGYYYYRVSRWKHGLCQENGYLFDMRKRGAPVIAAPQVTAVTAPRRTKTGQTLDNSAILEMVSRGLSENTIVATINERPGNYALYPDAVLALRNSGVPQAVIVAMSLNNDTPVRGPTR